MARVAEAIGMVQVDYSTVDRVRAEHGPRWTAREGFVLSRTLFVARAVVDALDAVPVLNASWHADDTGVVRHRSVDLGVDGVVVAGADTQRLRGIGRMLAARTGLDRPRPTFTLEAGAAELCTPALVSPAVATLGVGAVTRRPAVVALDDASSGVGVRPIGALTLVYDRRAVGTTEASRFLHTVRGALEARDWAAEL